MNELMLYSQGYPRLVHAEYPRDIVMFVHEPEKLKSVHMRTVPVTFMSWRAETLDADVAR